MRLLVAVFACALLISCGGDASSRTPTGPTPPPAPTTNPPNTFSVSGTVRDDKGAPVPDATVFVGCGACKTGPGFSSTTNASGFYSGRLPAGTWDMIVRKPGYTTLSVHGGVIVSSNATRDVTLTPGVVISGRTFEDGVGELTGVRVEVLTGPDAGTTDTTGPPGVPNAWSLSVLPGAFRIRATKDGYVPVEREIHAAADMHGVDFTMKWAYGSCLQAVAPVFFDRYRSSGGDEAVAVNANPERAWTATADQSWISITSQSPHQGPGQMMFRVLPYAAGTGTEPRTGAVMIRCSASEGQNVWVTQNPDCQATLTANPDTPSVFPASGGVGHLTIRTGVPGCRWRADSAADWIRAVGVNSWRGDYDHVSFVVEENRTGMTRTGAFIVGEKVWTVTQR